MLEIVMKSSEIYVLKESKLFNNEDIIGFFANLSMNHINDSYSKLSDYKIDINEEINKLKEKVKKYKEIRIWYSTIDNEQLCNLHYIIDLFKDYDIKIHTIDVGKEKTWSVACFHQPEIKKLLKYDYILTNEDKNNYIKKWDKLIKENKEMRIIDNNILKSYNYDYLDNKIKEILKETGEISYISLIGKCMGKELCHYHDSIFFESRVEELINKKEIIITKVQKEKNFIGEETDVKYIKLNEKE